MKGSPFLRKSLDRMSYPSFAKLLDTYASETQPATPPPVPASPTLRKVAITMEASRRVLTASGARQRMKEYTERYMENFAPWVKEQGGWVSASLTEACYHPVCLCLFVCLILFVCLFCQRFSVICGDLIFSYLIKELKEKGTIHWLRLITCFLSLFLCRKALWMRSLSMTDSCQGPATGLSFL